MYKSYYFNRRTNKVVTPPATPAVSLEDMKDYLRVDTTDDDALITSFIEAATDQVKKYLKRCLISETLESGFDRIPNDGGYGYYGYGKGYYGNGGIYNLPVDYANFSRDINLMFPPIITIDDITTFDRTNTGSVYASTNYELDEEGGRIYLNEGAVWPQNLRDREAVKIKYTCGYGTASSDIPPSIIQAIKILVGNMYDCRDECGMPCNAKALLTPYRIQDQLAAYGVY